MNASPEFIMEHAVSLRGPDQVDVLNITDNGSMWVNVTGRIGVDAGAMLGVHTEEDDGLLEGMYKSLMRWGIHHVKTVTFDLDTVSVSSDYGRHTSKLAMIESPTLEVPLTSDPPVDESWLHTMSATFFVSHTDDSAQIIRFVEDAWGSGSVKLQAHAPKVSIRGGSILGGSWRNRIKISRSDISTNIHVPIPHIPGLPDPDRNSHFPPISRLVTLQDFSVTSSSSSSRLSISASATMINPAPDFFKLTTPRIPFHVSLPSESTNTTSSNAAIPVASVSTAPFHMTHPNITLSITGHVLPLPPSSSASSTLSSFLSTYLSALPSPILVSTPYLPSFTLSTLFPAPAQKPHILRNVTIHDMKIKPVGGKLLATGTIFARVVLPRGMKVGLSVNRIFPDVVVFDGEVPEEVRMSEPGHLGKHGHHHKGKGNDDDEEDGLPPAPPLPSPLPERAFGHIRPEDWIDAMSIPEDDPEDGEEDEDGAAFAVSAKVVDIPLQVLTGRQKEFSNFVSKVIFGTDGALAGIMGSTYVAVDVYGMDGKDMELGALPFQGAVKVGKWGSSQW